MRDQLRRIFGRRSRLTNHEEKPISSIARPQPVSVAATSRRSSLVTKSQPDCRELCASCLGCIEGSGRWLAPASERHVDNGQGLVKTFLHHIHVSNLLDAVEQGCPICIILSNELMVQGLSENLSQLQEALPDEHGNRHIFLVCLVGKPGITEDGTGYMKGLSRELKHWSLTFECDVLPAMVRLEMIPSTGTFAIPTAT